MEPKQATEPAKEQIHAIVSGRVQGVGFRYFVKQQSESLGLTGWVRNLPEGQVEVLVEGETSKLEKLMHSLSYGPPGAIVVDVSVEWGKGTGEFVNFRVLSGY